MQYPKPVYGHLPLRPDLLHVCYYDGHPGKVMKESKCNAKMDKGRQRVLSDYYKLFELTFEYFEGLINK